MQAKNPRYTISSAIDLEIEHPDFGWIPFTASDKDTEQLGRYLYAQAKNGDFGPIDSYVPPPVPDPIPPTLEQVAEIRRLAYQRESDPLYFRAQRGESTIEEWHAAIADIKSRYPMPEA